MPLWPESDNDCLGAAGTGVVVERLAERDPEPERDDDEHGNEESAASLPPAAKPLSARAHGVKSTAPRA
jgi:hypothetical protein